MPTPAVLDEIVDYLRRQPDADVMWISARQGEGTPQPFSERYGFVPSGDTVDGEVVLRLDL